MQLVVTTSPSERAHVCRLLLARRLAVPWRNWKHRTKKTEGQIAGCKAFPSRMVECWVFAMLRVAFSCDVRLHVTAIPGVRIWQLLRSSSVIFPRDISGFPLVADRQHENDIHLGNIAVERQIAG